MDWEQLLASQPLTTPALLDALASQWGLDAGQLLAGMGDNALTSVILATCAEPGSQVVIPPGPLLSQAEQLGLEALSYQRGPDLALDLAWLIAASAAPRVSLTWLASPDPETGLALSPAQVQLLLSEGGSLLVIDNRLGLLAEQDYRPLVGHPRVLLVQGIPVRPWSQLELFWVAGRPDLLTRLRPFLVLPDWLHDTARRLPWPEIHQQLQAVIQNRQNLYLKLLGRGASPLISEGPFILVNGTSPLPASNVPGVPGYQRIDLQ